METDGSQLGTNGRQDSWARPRVSYEINLEYAEMISCSSVHFFLYKNKPDKNIQSEIA